MTDRPNILLITSDQQHYDTLGVTNPRIQTPALDRLAAEGTRFGRAYCPNPTCTPTRASILTGMYPSQHGAWTLGTKLFEDVPVLGDHLRRAGYGTSLIGKAHFQPLASRPGMESIECQPLLRDLDFWRKWHGPWYGFEHVETARNHAGESHAGQHYAIWMEENGLANWRDYFVSWPEQPGERKRIYSQRRWELPEQFHYSVWTAERSIARIERAAAEGRPFFLWSSFLDPHPPYMVPEPWASLYDPEAMVPGRADPEEHALLPRHFQLTQQERPDFSGYFGPDPKQAHRPGTQRGTEHGSHGFKSHVHDEAELRKDIAIYYGMISLMDREIGRILDALDATGQADNTLVVFSTDHGHFLGQHGLTAKGAFHFEDMIRVPFLVRWPGRTPAGATSEAIQSLVDLAPTFLSAAGVETPGIMTGLDQSSTWRGGSAVRDCAVVENHHTPTSVHLRTCVNETAKITVYREGNEGELFDLAADPGEKRNLWHDPAAAELKCRMLHEFMQATLADEPMRMPRIKGA